MKKLNYILVISLFLTTYWACTKAIIDESALVQPIDRIISYQADIEFIMFNHCITCHGGSAPAVGLDLTTYELVRESTENSNLWARVNDSLDPMPPSGLLPLQDIQLIEKWIADGFPEE